MAVTFYAGIIIVILVLVILGAILRQRRLRYTHPIPAVTANRVIRVEYTGNNGQAGVTPMPAPPPAYTRSPGIYPTSALDQNHCPVCGMPGDLDHVNHSPPQY